MSRIGKLPIEIPDKVEVTVDGRNITVKGPKGQQTIEIRPEISVKIEDNKIIFERKGNDTRVRAFHGLTRALVSNAVVGVTTGFSKTLELHGVGYRVAKEGNDLKLQLGYSHDVRVDAPEGIEFQVEGNNKIIVNGINKQLVGDISADIRSKRPPEVYKGKGVRYQGERIRRKAGKTGKK